MPIGSEYDQVLGEKDDRIAAALDAGNHNKTSVYNVRGYQPVNAELSQVPVRVTGTIPADLEGVYLRNGTNMQFEKTHIWMHAFNGAGMLHEVQIRNGSAIYSNTYIRTPRFQFEEKMKREVYLNFSDMAGAGRQGLEKLRLVEEKKRNGLIPNFSPLESSPASTSIQYYAGHLYCLQETGYAFRLLHRVRDGRLLLDGSGHLETWDGAWDGPFSAHPRVDPETGDFYSVSNDRLTNRIVLGRLSGGKPTKCQTIYQQTDETGSMAWVHDCILTENYVVFPDISMRYSRAALAGNTKSAYNFDPNYKMRWGLIPRDPQPGDSVRWFDTNTAAVIWHVVNGWEQTGPDGRKQIVLFSPKFHTYPSEVPIHTPLEPPAKLTKWVLDVGTGTVIEERVLLEHGYERPSLNLQYVSKKSRYAYLLDEEREGYMGKGVLKYDLEKEKEVFYFDYGEYSGGEALFVPRTNCKGEDDGYLLELLMADSKAELIIIDAKSMTECARLHLPQRVPFGVHACWLDNEKLRSLKDTA
ncbi:carotenoid oxygenase family protein [Bradyrhizobium tropiciagri]|uniref:carotenoid oxygenase family protein n=1 Tax=Bradyrhizobium tropiciagri TaxID=312253 RepID=UPI001BAC49B8|nr:carotenoid oxygenase family protein [Bradyrhizobium tropiciagri]MBR0898910.1 carotenoid oxygenase family protein [Bradyrhizobium tropiciagri]